MAAKTFSKPISFSPGNGTPRTFKSSDELLLFVEDEQEFWRFLADKVGKQRTQLSRNSLWPLDRLGALRESIAAFEDERQSEASVVDQVSATYSNEKLKIPTSDSPDAQALKAMARELDPETFFAAANAILRRYDDNTGIPRPNEYAMWTGIIAAALYRLGQSPEHARANANALEELRNQHAALLNVEEDKLAKQRAEWIAALEAFQNDSGRRIEEARAVSDEQREQADAALKSMLEQRGKELADARAEWAATHKAFTEQLHLQAPKLYWDKKSDGHKWRAVLWAAVSAAYLMAALWFMVGGIDDEYTKLLALKPETPLGAYIALAARGLVISVVVFWGGRIVVRMFLSELHLGMDAYERSTMVSTYLALTKDGAVTEKERSLVLAPLFRPTADGIVKDDASMDSNLAAMFGKLQVK